ncbi:DUF2065 domain-containing protein [Chelatococcus daeguensis]|uniref:DUF2065 domain-containing protein n=2 Tax=Chelatococcus TaxID=28209 RepID=A0AAC9NYZ6_9HYPH|nr:MULTISPECIES: DUF2065 domain-containing protein [Chelatococcus]APF38044.1 hypothetical protein BOQ54_12490 [Chelatococcus daeguensis]KZE28549.1 hypothetical protein AVW15_07070 [Chelatococcus daeguensis]MBM3083510.1 DUF2065 domain-containing protein [Chelatococcus daeguensis]CUA84119.1 Uncharacterized conserved protein YjeT, DUF2065 family [Chelatococcus sambhunathii]
MTDFLAALGLVLAIEGLIFAAFPTAAKRALAEASEAPVERMRLVGVVSAVVGVVIIWYVRWGGA